MNQRVGSLQSTHEEIRPRCSGIHGFPASGGLEAHGASSLLQSSDVRGRKLSAALPRSIQAEVRGHEIGTALEEADSRLVLEIADGARWATSPNGSV